MRLWILPALLACASASLAQDLNWLDTSGATKLRTIFSDRREQFVRTAESFQALGRPLDERDVAKKVWYERRAKLLTDGIEVLHLIAAGRELSDDYFDFVARAFEVYDGESEAPSFVNLIPHPRLLEPDSEGAILRDVTALVTELHTPVQLPESTQSEREKLEAQVRMLELQKELSRLEASHFELEAQLARTRLEVIETERLIIELENRRED